MDLGDLDTPFLVIRNGEKGAPAYEIVNDEAGVAPRVEAGLADGQDVQVFRMEAVPFQWVEEQRAHPAA